MVFGVRFEFRTNDLNRSANLNTIFESLLENIEMMIKLLIILDEEALLLHDYP